MTETGSVDAPETIEDALRLIPGPVAVIGAAGDGTLGGLTAAWVTRVSLDPPLLLVSIGHQRFSHELMSASAQFSVSVLAEDQVAVGRLFGLNSRREVDKWAQTEHVLLGEGVPALQHCSARMLCRKLEVFRTGDHDCFVGEVLMAETVAGGPALPMRGADYAPE